MSFTPACSTIMQIRLFFSLVFCALGLGKLKVAMYVLSWLSVCTDKCVCVGPLGKTWLTLIYFFIRIRSSNMYTCVSTMAVIYMYKYYKSYI